MSCNCKVKRKAIAIHEYFGTGVTRKNWHKVTLGDLLKTMGYGLIMLLVAPITIIVLLCKLIFGHTGSIDLDKLLKHKKK